jgi:hypothetical protein
MISDDIFDDSNDADNDDVDDRRSPEEVEYELSKINNKEDMSKIFDKINYIEDRKNHVLGGFVADNGINTFELFCEGLDKIKSGQIKWSRKYDLSFILFNDKEFVINGKIKRPLGYVYKRIRAIQSAIVNKDNTRSRSKVDASWLSQKNKNTYNNDNDNYLSDDNNLHSFDSLARAISDEQEKEDNLSEYHIPDNTLSLSGFLDKLIYNCKNGC